MTKNSLKRGLKWLVVAGVVGGGGGYGYWYWQHRQANAPQYQTVVVARGALTQTVTATGTLNPVVNVQVGSQISGIIEKLYVDYNSPVKQGQVIAQIDPATFSATVHQAEGNLANAQAALELTQVNEVRAKKLRESDLISQADYDQALANLHQAQAQVKINQASLENAKVNLDRCTIYSPTNGIVISRSVDVGQTVAASLSAPTIFVIANDLAKMQIDSNVAEADVGGVEVGQEVDFTVDAFPYRTFHGQVTQVRNAPITVQNVVTYDTVIEVSNKDLKLRPGMTANVSLIIAHRDNVVRIPNSALRFRPPEEIAAAAKTESARGRSPGGRSGGGSGNQGPGAGGPGGGGFAAGGRGGGGRAGGGGAGRARGERPPPRTVYVLPAKSNAEADPGEGKPRPVQIKTGISDGFYTEVSDGLSEGDRLVTGLAVTQAEPAARVNNPFTGGRRF
ncbi:MAG: efflux RND transporter periplasmic adaptor subunit [Limisphaerales bacterium]